jgi:disulfide bond formation protein DsbB
MSREDVQLIIGLLANAVFTAQFFLAGLIVVFLSGKFAAKNKTFKRLTGAISQNALILAFFISLFATAGSLFLSEIAHFVPCKLCWFQRIFMYPQVLILGIAALKNDASAKQYVLPMSVIGVGIAIYHYLLQMSPIPLPCTDEVASCAAKQFAHYGYMTIPFMSLVAFALIVVLTLFVKNKK